MKIERRKMVVPRISASEIVVEVQDALINGRVLRGHVANGDSVKAWMYDRARVKAGVGGYAVAVPGRNWEKHGSSREIARAFVELVGVEQAIKLVGGSQGAPEPRRPRAHRRGDLYVGPLARTHKPRHENPIPAWGLVAGAAAVLAAAYYAFRPTPAAASLNAGATPISTTQTIPLTPANAGQTTTAHVGDTITLTLPTLQNNAQYLPVVVGGAVVTSPNIVNNGTSVVYSFTCQATGSATIQMGVQVAQNSNLPAAPPVNFPVTVS
jgi:hypothetical protein